ncbi:hypothetical protein C8P70_103103 [Myroides indicus]|uniref:Outer membrane protein with beta-barrel domain n=2 Tax=Myroides indicus TaxID=1323422 RepID=A0A4R7F847_9FLAO|nr:hypothetical protein C8P70_103103 [Myroides indicus]
MLSVPILAKYNVAEKFNLLAGPSLNYNLDWDDEKFKLNGVFAAFEYKF